MLESQPFHPEKLSDASEAVAIVVIHDKSGRKTSLFVILTRNSR